MRDILFLGGSKDGEVILVPDDRHEVWVTKPEERSISALAFAAGPEQQLYVRQRVRGNTETFEVFALSGWTGDMLMRHLLRRATR